MKATGQRCSAARRELIQVCANASDRGAAEREIRALTAADPLT